MPDIKYPDTDSISGRKQIFAPLRCMFVRSTPYSDKAFFLVPSSSLPDVCFIDNCAVKVVCPNIVQMAPKFR